MINLARRMKAGMCGRESVSQCFTIVLIPLILVVGYKTKEERGERRRREESAWVEVRRKRKGLAIPGRRRGSDEGFHGEGGGGEVVSYFFTDFLVNFVSKTCGRRLCIGGK